MDTEACPIATPAKGASGAPSSACPTTGVATHTEDVSGCTALASNIMAVPGHTSPAMGASDTPSFVRSPMDAPTGCACSVNATTALAPLPLTSSAERANS